MPFNIDGEQMGALSKAIEDAFPTPMDLQQVVSFKLNDNIFNYAGFASKYPEVRFNFIQQYNAHWNIDRLVVALLEQIPDNGKLLEFAWRHQIVKRPKGSGETASVHDDSLERMLDPVRGFTDPMAFLRRFGEIVKCVCRIAVPRDDGVEYGTGFLIGDQTVLTNYHVVERAIKKSKGADRKKVTLLFDYRTGPDGKTLSDGVEFKLLDDEENWLIDHSPYHTADLTPSPIPDIAKGNGPMDHLDYAVLRVAGDPGKKRLGKKASLDGRVRGHLELPASGPDETADFKKGKAAVFLFQHPKADPLRLDWEKPAILGVNKNRTRVMYDVNTLHGSSGSPCFNAKLELIALHHAGGKDWPAGAKYRYNQGIPISRIRELLEHRGKLGDVQ
jgi:hypothetical protein